MTVTMREFYRTAIFEHWATKEGLLDIERLLLEKVLVDRSKRVVEAGTGNGRIAFHIERMGFRHVEAFDLVPELVAVAKRRGRQNRSRIRFFVGDILSLPRVRTASYDYLVYLQQVLCMVPATELKRALAEAFRIARPGAIGLFSFLRWESRPLVNPLLGMAVALSRRLRGKPYKPYHLPWLNVSGRLNLRLLSVDQPLAHWPRPSTVLTNLREVGFEILEAKTGGEYLGGRPSGMLYTIVRKPGYRAERKDGW